MYVQYDHYMNGSVKISLNVNLYESIRNTDFKNSVCYSSPMAEVMCTNFSHSDFFINSLPSKASTV